jgi:NAD-dependent deacetylase
MSQFSFSPEKKARIVVLTGAGISAESGISTFRDADGLWEGHDIMKVATPQGFAQDPAQVHRFYNLRRSKLNFVSANPGHEALARLEREWSGDFLLITQNVDDLHERAGSKKLVHIHGELKKARCGGCGWVGEWLDDLSIDVTCNACNKKALMRPHIVWFEEVPFHLDECYSALASADFFISVGTSGHVYPAAGFVELTPSNCRRIEVNTAGTEISAAFHDHVVGPAAQMLPALVDAILSGRH